MWRPPVALAIGLAITAPVWWPAPFTLTDHLIFWSAGHEVVTGGTPYARETWVAVAAAHGSTHVAFLLESGHEIWLYPPWTALLFAPFGLLPAGIGVWVLHAAYVAASVLAVTALIARERSLTPRVVALACLVAITYQPLVIAARWGQFTSLTLLGATVALAAAQRPRAPALFVAGLLLGAKPQFGAAPGLALGLLAAHRGARRALVLAALALGAVVAAGLALQPTALAAIARGAGQRAAAFELFPTTWGFARLVAGDAWPIAGGALVLLAAMALVLGVRSAARRSDAAIAAALAFAVVLVPYALTYEHALLLPALVSALGAAAAVRGAARAMLLAGIVLLSSAMWAVFIAANGAPLGFAPTAAAVLFGAAHLAAGRSARG